MSDPGSRLGAYENELRGTEDLATERAVIGRVLIDCATVPGLLPEHFRGATWRSIYAAARRLEAQGKLTLPELRLALGGEVDAKFLADLTVSPPPARLAWQFVERLHELARVRSVVAESDGLVRAALDGERARAFEHLEAIQDALEPKLGGQLVGMDGVEAKEPFYLAGGMVREGGVHLWWGPPNQYKTYLCAWLAMEMTQRVGGDLLFGIEKLSITRPWQRVLWLGDEESAEEWKWRAENLVRGNNTLRRPGDEILFADATGGKVMLTTDHIGDLLDQAEAKHGSVDAVFIDPLPNMLPEASQREGDPNPSALARVCRPLRRIAKLRRVAIYMLTHPNASGTRERGATAYRGSADVVVEVKMDSGRVSLIDVKNRDREKATVSFLPEWTWHGEEDDFALAFTPTATPAQSETRKFSSGKRAMYAAAQAGAGRITKLELFDAQYSSKDKADVSKRTKERWWKELVDADLVLDDSGVVRLLDPRDDDDDEKEPAT